ncbi:YbaB/EbfC family nucleoid-associated protein [Nocardia anaemiae]|uniref:YbaB/EbfC family nucleoid-associated protein n=1 Tax=Nocardia anaemiae TaxID=263910 RepID=UPI0007A54754|nr:YbaB/EbfC family nucleoid-associated protein [Nocardia anaemiae]
MDEYTERRAAHLKRLNAAVSEVRGSSRSADGGVYVEADARGTITALYIEPYALEAGARRLELLIADQHRIAYANAQAEAERIYTELSQNAPTRRS